jgi:hypothetical protein
VVQGRLGVRSRVAQVWSRVTGVRSRVAQVWSRVTGVRASVMGVRCRVPNLGLRHLTKVSLVGLF